MNEGPILLSILRCPNTGQPLLFNRDAQQLETFDQLHRYSCKGEISNLLSLDVENQEIKEKEKEGWKKIFEKNQWAFTADRILELPEKGEAVYWDKTSQAFNFVLNSRKSWDGLRGLDLAAGIGWATAKFANRGAQMIACDFNDTEYNGLGTAVQLKEKNLEFDAICADGEVLPIADDSLDFVFICSALHHFTRPIYSLKEIHRILKPGGKLYNICESFKTGFHDQSREEDYEPLVEFRDAGINENTYTQKTYESMYQESGFDLQTYLMGWDVIDHQQPASSWHNAGLKNKKAHHKNLAIRFIINALGFGPFLKINRARLLNLTVVERIFIASK